VVGDVGPQAYETFIPIDSAHIRIGPTLPETDSCGNCYGRGSTLRLSKRRNVMYIGGGVVTVVVILVILVLVHVI
jgi:hypothetical protein